MRDQRHLWVLIGIALLSVATYGIRWRATPVHTYQDSHVYLALSYDLGGMSQPEARVTAAAYTCRTRFPDRDPESCLMRYLDIPERYLDIFESRIGYPLVSAPFVALFGPSGLTFGAALLGVAWAVTFALAIRASGGSLIAMISGIVFVFMLPTGGWAIAKLAEGAAYLGATGFVLGAMVTLRGRIGAGVGIMAGSMAWLGLTKAANAVSLGVVMTGLLVLPAVFMKQPDTRKRSLVVAVSGLASAVIVAVLLELFGQPGLQETLQDLYTTHFSVPDVPDPIKRLITDLQIVVPHWIGELLTSPLILISILASLGAIYWMAHRESLPAGPTFLLWLGLGLSGVPLYLVHPVNSEIPRLLATMWMPVAAGFAAALTAGTRQRSVVELAPSGDP